MTRRDELFVRGPFAPDRFVEDRNRVSLENYFLDLDNVRGLKNRLEMDKVSRCGLGDRRRFFWLNSRRRACSSRRRACSCWRLDGRRRRRRWLCRRLGDGRRGNWFWFVLGCRLRGLRRDGRRFRHAAELGYPACLYGGANELVLARQPLTKLLFVEVALRQVRIAGPLAGEDRAAIVDERHQLGLGQTFVLGLDMVDNTVVLDICIKARNHSLKQQRNRLDEGQERTGRRRMRCHLKLTYAAIYGQ
jgi:hypothetical protein